MGDKYVSNSLMMSTKNNLYQLIPFLKLLFNESCNCFCKFMTPLSSKCTTMKMLQCINIATLIWYMFITKISVYISKRNNKWIRGILLF